VSRRDQSQLRTGLKSHVGSYGSRVTQNSVAHCYRCIVGQVEVNIRECITADQITVCTACVVQGLVCIDESKHDISRTHHRPSCCLTNCMRCLTLLLIEISWEWAVRMNEKKDKDRAASEAMTADFLLDHWHRILMTRSGRGSLSATYL